MQLSLSASTQLSTATHAFAHAAISSWGRAQLVSLGLCAAIRQVEVALIAEIVGRRLGADCFEATWHCQAPLFAVIPACLPHPSPTVFCSSITLPLLPSAAYSISMSTLIARTPPYRIDKRRRRRCQCQRFQ